MVDCIICGYWIMIALEPYLGWLRRLWGQTLEVATAVVFFVYATRLGQDREKEEAPRMLLPIGSRTRQPGIRQKTKHRWLWAKSAVITLSFGVVVIAMVFGFGRLHKKAAVGSTSQVSPASQFVRKPKVEPKSGPSSTSSGKGS
jgi:hypothetical protein